jgi:AraC family transcriptional regulator of arabinose operon
MEHTLPWHRTHFDVRLNTRPTYWHCEPGWEWKSPPLHDHLLWYVMDGIGTMRLDSQQWELRGGSCFIFAPGDQPYSTQDPHRRLVVFGMHFEVLDGEKQTLLECDQFYPARAHTIRDTAFIELLAQRCDASYRHNDDLGRMQSQVFLQAILLQIWQETLHAPPSLVDQVLGDIINDIRREPGNRWSVSELAQRAHLSHAQFVRRFRAMAGCSPVHFMIQARLERARQLILETDMSLGQIANALGYEDVYFFSRQYKQYTGIAPSSLRRQ